MRRTLPALLALLLAGCGGTGTTGQFGEVPLVLPARASANDVGVYFATARGYDEADGVTLQPRRSGQADFRITDKPPAGCVAVAAIVQPDKLVLCVDKFILSDERDKVQAVADALSRGYTQAQLEPDEAAQATVTAGDGRLLLGESNDPDLGMFFGPGWSGRSREWSKVGSIAFFPASVPQQSRGHIFGWPQISDQPFLPRPNGARYSQVIVPFWLLLLTVVAFGTAPWFCWRFSLRTLLLATALVAVILGGIVYAVRS